MIKKYQKLLQLLATQHKIAVAFSGGVDSTFLLYAAIEALGAENVVALSIVTPYVPQWEQEEAKEFAQSFGVSHHICTLDFPEELRLNPHDHCYTCKKILFTQLLSMAEETGCTTLIDGTNLDDLSDYRPGLIALQELSILSPMVEVKLTKDEIRGISHQHGLSTWNKPSFACLLSRLPVGKKVNERDFTKIEKAERYLMKRGFPAVRLRHHGDVARIEVPQHEIIDLLQANSDGEIERTIKAMGYRHVAVDIGGYRMGSLNRPVGDNNE